MTLTRSHAVQFRELDRRKIRIPKIAKKLLDEGNVFFIQTAIRRRADLGRTLCSDKQ